MCLLAIGMSSLENIQIFYPFFNQVVFFFMLSCMSSFGERNGNPLQCSCLENPVDRGAWWAAVHRVAQSRTRLNLLSMHACIGEGNGNPLRYSCLENPRDREAWWAAIYGVSQSWTRLKQLSSSSSMSSLNMLAINPLSVVSFANIFSHSIGCLFVTDHFFVVHKF